MATGHTTVSATFPKHTLHSVRFYGDGLDQATPAQVLKYLAFRAAGNSPEDAKALLFGDLKVTWKERGNREQVSVPQDIVDAIRAAYPDKSIAWALRYQAAFEMFGDHEAAESIADSIQPYHGGRPVGVKETRPRKPRATKPVIA